MKEVGKDGEEEEESWEGEGEDGIEGRRGRGGTKKGREEGKEEDEMEEKRKRSHQMSPFAVYYSILMGLENNIDLFPWEFTCFQRYTSTSENAL